VSEEDDILAILMAPSRRAIEELKVAVDPRGALAAFWDGFTDGQHGIKKKHLDYDEPAIYRRAWTAGSKSF